MGVWSSHESSHHLVVAVEHYSLVCGHHSSSSHLHYTDPDLTDLGDTDLQDTIEDVDDDDTDTMDSTDYVLLPPSSKRFDPTLLDSTTRPRSHQRSRLQEEGRQVRRRNSPVKRSRENTLKQLIKLCRRTDEEEGDDMGEDDPQVLQLHSMLDRLSGAPVYIKRFGSILDRQDRARNLVKKTKNPVKRNIKMLKKILMECLLEKDILEAQYEVRKPTTQFLRFGRG